MTRDGKISESKKERIVLRVKCKSVELFIVGAGSKVKELFEGYAIASLPTPIEIDKIETVQRVKLREDFYEILETYFSHNE